MCHLNMNQWEQATVLDVIRLLTPDNDVKTVIRQIEDSQTCCTPTDWTKVQRWFDYRGLDTFDSVCEFLTTKIF